MPAPHDHTGLQLRSLVRTTGELELSLERVHVPEPRADEVVIRVEATPINPSDLGVLLGGADVASASASGTPERPVATLRIPEAAMRSMAARADVSMAVGNEGAGVVVAAGSSDAAQALLRRSVAVLGGAMYSQFRCVPADQCLVLPDDASPADGASAFVNPLTALGMVETMRREGHRALVHTAAASNLGQMLNRLCLADGVPLVNIVRRAEQADLLRRLGAKFVCSSDSSAFSAELADAIAATGATLAFDATGGGRLAGQILSAMEVAITRDAKDVGRYGSTTHKQVYLYGGLDPSPTELVRNFGMAWGLGGWLVFPFLEKIGPEAAKAMKGRVIGNLRTLFRSEYAREISLAEALHPEVIAAYGRRATGEKFLINPNKLNAGSGLKS
jgi:NADPH2:quinone reductase